MLGINMGVVYYITNSIARLPILNRYPALYSKAVAECLYSEFDYGVGSGSIFKGTVSLAPICASGARQPSPGRQANLIIIQYFRYIGVCILIGMVLYA